MSQRHYRSPFGDTTFTKVFVGGLAWETPTDVMRSHFEPFGEILEAVIINDKNTGKSKGYGFVTFRDPESATRACADPNPVIDGRRANCNIASLGRRRPSPPRGRNQVGNLQQGGGATPYGSVPPLPRPVPPPPPVIYRPYGYSTYPPDFGYHQPIYSSPVQQSHHYNHLYGGSSSSMGSPYFYGYSLHTPRGAFSMPPPQRYHGPSYLYYHTALPDPSAAAYSPLPMQMPTRIPYTSIADSAATPQIQAENEAGPVSSTTTSA